MKSYLLIKDVLYLDLFIPASNKGSFSAVGADTVTVAGVVSVKHRYTQTSISNRTRWQSLLSSTNRSFSTSVLVSRRVGPFHHELKG